MVGRWEAGIVPRHLAYVVENKLAVCERPGGVSGNHRQVRRKEEILWLKAQGFTRVVSLLGPPYNLHAYTELGLAYVHYPALAEPNWRAGLLGLFQLLDRLMAEGEKVAMHAQDLDDQLAGVCASYLVWSGRSRSGPTAIATVESAVKRQLGPPGREIVAYVLAGRLPSRRNEIEPPE
jgi:hypothetical protein